MTHVTDGQGNITNISIDTGGAHGWQVLGTLLGMGGIGAIAYAMAQAGFIDFAATALTMFFFQFVTLMFKSGVLQLPEQKANEFTATSGILRTIWQDYQRFQANSPVWRLAMLALGYTVLFMLMRYLLTLAMGIFDNVWVASGLVAFLAALIVAPQMFTKIFRGMNNVRANAKPKAAAQPAAAQFDPTQPGPAPAAPASPVTPEQHP